MLSLLLAAAAADVGPAHLREDPDLRCVLALSVAIGGLSTSSPGAPQQVVALTAGVWYFSGKVDVRYPEIDMAAELAGMANAPGYGARLRTDIQRCAHELEVRGTAMQEMGRKLQEMAPLADSRHG